MSSTYLHYSSTSGSLPSDYGLLSRYRQANVDDDEQNIHSENDISNDPEHPYDHNTITNGPFLDVHDPLTRRGSFPGSAAHHRTAYLSTPPPSQKASPWPEISTSEREPLLGRIPRIQEDDGPRGEDSNVWFNELWILCKYTWPVFGTHVLEYSLVVASVVSIGHLSTTALAAATLGSMTASVTGFSIIQGFVSCLDTLLPSAWTSSHPELVGLWSQRMAVILTFTLIPIIGIWVNAEYILLLLRQDPEVASLAGIYLRWSILGLPAYAFNNVSRRYFQSQGLFTVPTRIVMVVAPINAALNYLLVWGPAPIRLGFIGAPLATAISFNLMSLASILYGMFWTPATAWHPFSRRCFKGLAIVLQLGLAGVGQTASEWWSWELVGLAASFLGAVSLASQSVLLVSCSTSYQAPFALGVATSVRVGNLLGEHNAKRAGIAAQISLVITLGMAAVLSSIFLIFRRHWARIFNDDPEVATLVASVLPLVALFQVFDGLCATTGGILRARGRQFTGALLNLSAYYVAGIPFGLLLAFRFKVGLIGLWIGLTCALVYAALVGVWLCLRTDWDKEVQKVQDRVERERELGKRLAGEIQRDSERLERD